MNPLLPKAQLEKYMTEWRESHREPTTEECLEILRFEWQMTWQVYGDKVQRERGHSKQRKEAIKKLCARLHRIERTASILKERINLDGQQELF